MESQRVRCLTEGYLRGWLKFDYTHRTSRIREQIVVSHLEDEWLYGLLENRLLIETVLRSGKPGGKGSLDPIFDVQKSLIGLKLPSAVPKDTIEKDDKELSKDDLAAWKVLLDRVNQK